LLLLTLLNKLLLLLLLDGILGLSENKLIFSKNFFLIK
jgi:hypothetical protein